MLLTVRWSRRWNSKGFEQSRSRRTEAVWKSASPRSGSSPRARTGAEDEAGIETPPSRESFGHCDGARVEAMPWLSDKHPITRVRLMTIATWRRMLP